MPFAAAWTAPHAWGAASSGLQRIFSSLPSPLLQPVDSRPPPGTCFGPVCRALSAPVALLLNLVLYTLSILVIAPIAIALCPWGFGHLLPSGSLVHCGGGSSAAGFGRTVSSASGPPGPGGADCALVPEPPEPGSTAPPGGTVAGCLAYFNVTEEERQSTGASSRSFTQVCPSPPPL